MLFFFSPAFQCFVGDIRECSSDNKDTVFNQHNDELYMSARGLDLSFV